LVTVRAEATNLVSDDHGYDDGARSGGRSCISNDSFPHAGIFIIFEGTSEIQRMIIGQVVTGLGLR